MKITITIKDFNDFDLAFQKHHKMDFKEWLQETLNQKYMSGKTIIAQETAEPTIISQMVKVE